MENSPINLKDFLSDQKKQQEILGAQADIKFRFYQSALDLCETAKVGEFNSIRFGVSEYEMSLCGKWLMTDFSKEDWEYVIDYISEYAIEAEDDKYSAYVFMLYAWFIEESVAQIAVSLSEEKQGAILALSDKLKTKTELFSKEEITEVSYIEDCLWISLEAMIKLISGTIDVALGFDKNQVVEAAMMLGMEYGRFVLYKKEHELVTEYLNNQKMLDVELAMRYDEYIEELNVQAAQFESFINSAFDGDLGDRLKTSVDLARAAGVDESEILKSTQDIDDYFL